jgi:hypothetical protein
VEAQTYVSTSQNHSAEFDGATGFGMPDFPNTSSGLEVGSAATGSPGSPGFDSNTSGDPVRVTGIAQDTLESGDGTVFVNLLAGVVVYVGSYVGGPAEPACTFFGYYDSY